MEFTSGAGHDNEEPVAASTTNEVQGAEDEVAEKIKRSKKGVKDKDKAHRRPQENYTLECIKKLVPGGCKISGVFLVWRLTTRVWESRYRGGIPRPSCSKCWGGDLSEYQALCVVLGWMWHQHRLIRPDDSAVQPDAETIRATLDTLHSEWSERQAAAALPAGSAAAADAAAGGGGPAVGSAAGEDVPKRKRRRKAPGAGAGESSAAGAAEVAVEAVAVEGSGRGRGRGSRGGGRGRTAPGGGRALGRASCGAPPQELRLLAHAIIGAGIIVEHRSQGRASQCGASSLYCHAIIGLVSGKVCVVGESSKCPRYRLSLDMLLCARSKLAVNRKTTCCFASQRVTRRPLLSVYPSYSSYRRRTAHQRRQLRLPLWQLRLPLWQLRLPLSQFLKPLHPSGLPRRRRRPPAAQAHCRQATPSDLQCPGVRIQKLHAVFTWCRQLRGKAFK